MDRKKRILIVEDNEDDIELTVRAFNKQGLVNQIDIVRDGQEALDYLFAEGAYASRSIADTPAVVLLDLQLPKIEGLEVLRKLRDREETKFVPVVILTTSKEDQDLINGYKLGANSYIRKPVDFMQFTDAVKQLGFYWLLLNERPLDS